MHAMIPAEPVEAGCKTFVLRRVVVFNQSYRIVTDDLPRHAVEKPERGLYAVKPVSLIFRKVGSGKNPA